MKKYTIYILLIFSPFLVNAQANLIVGSNATLSVGEEVFLGSGNINNKGEINIIGNVTTINLETSGIDSLSIMSNATRDGSLITTGTVTNNGGTYRIERFFDVSGGTSIWHLVSSPVDDEISGIYHGHFLDWYDEDNGAFHAYHSTTEKLNVGEGYVAKLDFNDSDGDGVSDKPNPIVHKANKLNTGNPTRPLIMYTGHDANPTKFDFAKGFNLVGNPFPSSIDWNKVYEANINAIDASYYRYYDDQGDKGNGTWKPYLHNENSGDHIINIGQGFGVVIKTNPTVNIITIPNSSRTHDVGSGFGKKNNQISNSFNLIASSNGLTDEISFRINNNATVDYDGLYDAYKFNSFGENPTPSFISSDNKKLSICQTPAVESINLGFNMSIDHEVTFSIADIDGFSEIILEDKNDGSFTNLMQENYSFQYSIGSDELGRFTLHFTRDELGNVENNIGVKVFYAYNSINIEPNKPLKNTSVNIYNMSGQLIFNKYYPILEHEKINFDFTRGLYIIEVYSHVGKTMTRVSITHNNL